MGEKLTGYEKTFLKLLREKPTQQSIPMVTLEFDNEEDLIEFCDKLPIQGDGYEIEFEDQLDWDDILKVVVKIQKIGCGWRGPKDKS